MGVAEPRSGLALIRLTGNTDLTLMIAPSLHAFVYPGSQYLVFGYNEIFEP
jgi:hypothetical protein